MGNQDKAVKQRIATLANYKTVFDNPVGKRVLWDILREGNILEISHTHDAPHETAFQEGKRAMALYIFAKLKTDITKLQRYLDEGEKYERERRGDDDDY